MRRSAIIPAGIAMVVIALVLLIVASRIGDKKVHVRGRLLVEINQPAFYQYFVQDREKVLPDFLNRPENRLALARLSNTDEKHFALVEIRPVRETRIIYLHYAGNDSNTVLCVASNAANMLAAYYVTNQPAFVMTNGEAEFFTPITFWERLKWTVQRLQMR